jgi:phage terminase large subunit
MRRKFVLLALKYPKLKLLLLRRTLPELRENHVMPLLSELYGIAKYKDQDKMFIFPNGSRIVLGYCDAEKDVYRYQGHEYDVIGLEEATHFTETMRDFFETCNRSTRSDFKPRMYYTSNPGGIGHAWFKRLFIDKEVSNAQDYVFIPAKVYDNHALMNANPEYVKTLENLPHDQREAFLHGNWDVFAGQYFREWRRDTHVIDPIELPRSWFRFCSIDYGYHDPCAIYWHAVNDQRIYTYRELYINQTNASDIAKKIMELSRGENIEYTVASPDMWHKRGGAMVSSDGQMKGESIADIFLDAGVWLEKADNDRVIGWTRMREYMKIQPDGKPLWIIFSNCTNLIRTLPQLVHDERRVEDVADGLEDHAAESCRYALMSRPQPSGSIVSSVVVDMPNKVVDSPFVMTDAGFRHKDELKISNEDDEESAWFGRFGW